MSIAAAPAPSPWFRSAAFDLPLLLAVPLFTWPLVAAAQEAWGAPLLNQLILVSATGHYVATFVRAYGDRDLFARFRTRFVLAPLLLLPLCLVLLHTGHRGALMLVTAGWAFWHWLAQAFGFARLYDHKVGSHGATTARLDKALVITGFLGAVTLNDGSLATFGKQFLDAGIPLPGAAAFRPVQHAVLAAMLVVGIGYLANLLRTIARGEPWSWQKQVMHATTIGYYWFAFAWVDNVLVAYVLYELFHDVQYYAISWLACRQRARRPGVTAWFAWLARPGVLGTTSFLLLMLGLGALDYGARNTAGSEAAWHTALAFSLTAALLHYYYDGFVWKARERALGADLGLTGGLQARAVPLLRHAGAWALFVVPLGLLLALATPITDPQQRSEQLAALAPGDFLSRADRGFELTRAGDLPAALDHYAASIAANPRYGQARANYGAALELAGEPERAREQYEAALALPDRESAHRQAHTNLGVLLLLRGDRAGADVHFAAAARLGGGAPVARMLGLAAALPADRAEQRQKLWNAVLQLAPDQPDARFGLGEHARQLRRWELAASHFAAVLRQNPNHVPALLGSAECQLELGAFEAARTAVQRVLQLEPGNARAQALQARAGR